MVILGIESTCDETGVAVVIDGHDVIFSEIATSVALQQKFKGVVPEVAAREQVKYIIPLVERAFLSVGKDKIDAIAVAFGPGLVGPLLVGVETAKALAYSLDKPLIAVNHLMGHFYANWINREVEIKFPAISLIVSGGHTDLLYFKNPGTSTLLGSTLDDAAGEAFDKVAKKLGLKYPGGPEIERMAQERIGLWGPNPFPLPLARSGDFNFSFSGLKTAVVAFKEKNPEVSIAEVCHFFQDAVVKILLLKTSLALKKFDASSIVVGGGVAANQLLRDKFLQEFGVENTFFPEKKFSVDNGAMIATAAFYNQNFVNPLKLTADPGLHF